MPPKPAPSSSQPGSPPASTTSAPPTPAASQNETETQQEAGGEDQQPRECPICVMMREGGCEKQFHAFMDCGAAAEKGERDYEQCLTLFQAMSDCMKANPTVFAPILGGMEDAEGGKQSDKTASDSAAQ